jgi:hypothetical protein
MADADKRPTGTIRHRCPHCKRDTFLSINAPHDIDELMFGGPAWLEKIVPDLESKSNPKDNLYLTETWTKCPEADCRGPIYIACRYAFGKAAVDYYAQGGWHHTSVPTWMRILAMFPHGSRAELDPAVPERIRTEWAGLIELAEQHRSPAVVTMGCRAVLELALKELEATVAHEEARKPKRKANTLQERIDRLAEEGTITHTLKNWAHQLRLDGNDGAHDLKGDAERALTFARFVEFFLEATFVMESRLKTVQRLPTDPADLTLEDLLA